MQDFVFLSALGAVVSAQTHTCALHHACMSVLLFVHMWLGRMYAHVQRLLLYRQLCLCSRVFQHASAGIYLSQTI